MLITRQLVYWRFPFTKNWWLEALMSSLLLFRTDYWQNSRVGGFEMAWHLRDVTDMRKDSGGVNYNPLRSSVTADTKPHYAIIFKTYLKLYSVSQNDIFLWHPWASPVRQSNIMKSFGMYTMYIAGHGWGIFSLGAYIKYFGVAGII